MINLQKFNLIYIIGLWVIILLGFYFIYTFPTQSNIIFWVSLFFIWSYSYRPIVNKFFYTKMMDDLSVNLVKLDNAFSKLKLDK